MSSRIRILRAGNCSVSRSGFSSDGSRLLAWADNVPSLLDVRTQHKIGKLGSPGDVVISGAFTPAGDRVITSSKDSVLRIWDAESGAALAAHPSAEGPAESLAVAPDGMSALVGGFGTLTEIDLGTGEVRARFEIPEDFWVMRCAFATAGNRVIAADNHHSELAVWDRAGGKMAASVRRDDAYLAEIAEVNPDLRPDQEGWDFTPDAKFGIALFHGGHKVFDISTGAELAKLIRMPEGDWEWHPRRNNPSHVTSRAVSPADDRLAVAFEDGALTFWNLSGAELWRKPMNPERHYARTMAFSADGSRLFTAAITGPLALWDTADGTQLANHQGRRDGGASDPWSCALAPDGQTAACGVGDGTIILWDLRGY
jgi:WD40 repeat protein